MIVFPRLTHWSGILLLVVGLLLAQFALVEHGIEHAFHDHDQACAECLALPGMQAVPKPALRVEWPPAVAIAGDSAVPPAPTFELRLAFRGRAPPALHD